MPNKDDITILIDILNQNFEKSSFKTKIKLLEIEEYCFGGNLKLYGKLTSFDEEMNHILKSNPIEKSRLPIEVFFVYFKNEADASNFKLLFSDILDNNSNIKNITTILSPIIRKSLNNWFKKISEIK
jgi:small nuclear ribonucleoprotein (snRNP)-like protein